MAGQSTVVADEEQRTELDALAKSRERGEADRARCILLTLSGWSSPRLAEAFGVREDTVRLWRMEFMASGVEALRTRVAAGACACEGIACAGSRGRGPVSASG
jgi:Helix-turn-helix domain